MNTSASARLKEARRIVRAQQVDRLEQRWTSSTAVVIGGLVLLGTVAWSIDTADGSFGRALTERALQVALCAAFLVATLPTALGPVRASEGELWFFIEGAVGPGPLLRRRIAGWASGSAIVLGAASATTGAALALPVAEIASRGVSGASCGVLLLAVSVLSALAPRARWVLSAGALMVLLAVVAGGPRGMMLSAPWLTATVGVAAAVCCALALRAVDGASIARLHRDAERRGRAEAALLSGDIALIAPAMPSGRYHLRHRTPTFRRGLIARTIQRDVLGLRRVPWSTALGTLTIVAAGALAGGATSPGAVDMPWTWGAAVLLGQAGLLPVSVGLRARAAQSGADVLEPEPFGRRVQAHLVVPGAIAILGATVGVACGLVALADQSVAGGAEHLVAPWCSSVLAATTALAVHVWLAASGSAPLWVLAPVASPIGELSGLVFVAWMGRGLVPAIVGTAIIGAAGTVPGAVVVTIATSTMAAWRLRSWTRLG